MSPSFKGKVRAKKVMDFSDIPSLGEWVGTEESPCQDLNPSPWGQQHENEAHVSSTCEGRLWDEVSELSIHSPTPTPGTTQPRGCWAKLFSYG